MFGQVQASFPVLEHEYSWQSPSWASEGGMCQCEPPQYQVNLGAKSQGQGTKCPFMVPPRKAHKVQPLYPHMVPTCSSHMCAKRDHNPCCARMAGPEDQLPWGQFFSAPLTFTCTMPKSPHSGMGKM